MYIVGHQLFHLPRAQYTPGTSVSVPLTQLHRHTPSWAPRGGIHYTYSDRGHWCDLEERDVSVKPAIVVFPKHKETSSPYAVRVLEQPLVHIWLTSYLCMYFHLRPEAYSQPLATQLYMFDTGQVPWQSGKDTKAFLVQLSFFLTENRN